MYSFNFGTLQFHLPSSSVSFGFPLGPKNRLRVQLRLGKVYEFPITIGWVVGTKKYVKLVTEIFPMSTDGKFKGILFFYLPYFL